MTVRATDTGRPPRVTDVNVVLSISRIVPPVFTSSPYTTTISENIGNGTSVLTVKANPGNTNTNPSDIVYEIIGNPPAPYYFSIDPIRGDIRVLRSIRFDTNTRYNVSTNLISIRL